MTKLDDLRDLLPWEWPDDARDTLLAALREPYPSPEDLELAVDLAGDPVMVDDTLADGLLAVARRVGADPEIRARAARALGPALDVADDDADDEFGEPPVSRLTAQRLEQALHELHAHPSSPDQVRRAALEASSHSPAPWHEEAVREAFARQDDEWRLTAVFCMRFVPGFNDEILEALGSANPGIQYEAICAAGYQAVDAAWDEIVDVLSSPDVDKPVLLAAIEALASIRPEAASEELGPLLESDDEEIVETACAAMGFADALVGIEADLDEDDSVDEEKR